MWATTACRPILLKSTVFVHQIHLVAYGLLDTRLHPERKVSFPWGCTEFPENSMSFTCSEKPGFPGLWPPWIKKLVVRQHWGPGHNDATTTTTVLRHFLRDHPGEPVPENFWTLWCKGRLTEANTRTIRLGATPSGLTSAHLHHPPFFTGRMPFMPPKSVKALKATSALGLGRRC